MGGEDAVEALADGAAGLLAGRAVDVLEEVRRGYLWRGRVFRFAQVRVARS